MNRKLIPVVAVLTVSVVGAWWFLEPKAAPPRSAVPAAGGSGATAATGEASPPTPAPRPLLAAPPSATMPAPSPAPDPAAPTSGPLTSPFSREVLAAHLDVLQQAGDLVRAGKPYAGAQVLLDRAAQASPRDADRLRAVAARIFFDADQPDQARAILRGGPKADPALDGEYKALDARINHKQYRPPRLN